MIGDSKTMVSMVIYDKNDKEKQLIREIVKNKVAFITEDKWNISMFDDIKNIESMMSENSLIDLSCFEVTGQGTTAVLENVRKKYNDIFMMVVADSNISPMTYMRPSIMPASLLLRPYNENDMKQVVEEFVEVYVSKNAESDDSSFVIDSKEGKIHIPYSQIYYFEARDKKVYINTGKEEYGFYKTIDTLESELPDIFMRCHRSFIINKRKLKKVMLSQNTVLLSEDIYVPLSRSYKAEMKELGKK